MTYQEQLESELFYYKQEQEFQSRQQNEYANHLYLTAISRIAFLEYQINFLHQHVAGGVNTNSK